MAVTVIITLVKGYTSFMSSSQRRVATPTPTEHDYTEFGAAERHTTYSKLNGKFQTARVA